MSDQPTVIDRFLARTLLRCIPYRITPNQVTMVRFFTTPIVLYLLLVEEYHWGLLAFLLVALTDAIDGALARTRNQITDWGKLYDPLADKLLIGSVVFAVVVRELDVLLGLSIITIEVVIIGLAWYGRAHGRVVQANAWGKVKMWLEVIGVALLLLGLAFGVPEVFPISQASFVLAIIFALVSLVTYGI
ncbi:CDP-alcohol phosphatidyltransferase family protein [Candidatus Uhrbacteria bacterium]|nr:CDP-alcohol phosphatidyltransferase family protein [Candidatus Uhrbacteria bacterium]